MLARIVEAAGIPTVTVSTMADVSAKQRLSRLVAVEFPFGHSFGTPHNDELSYAVSALAVRALRDARGPGYRLDLEPSEHPYPVPTEIAYKTWHPPQPSPIVARMLQQRQQQQ